MVRTRFAPSPTGYLHVGGLRTALYNYIFARKHHGSFVLRIEDTDQERKVEGAIENLIETLKWTGIIPDEGPGFGGDYGPYIQSERLELYRRHAEILLEKELAYYCFCSQERLEILRQEQIAKKQPPRYDNHCRNLPADEVKRKLQSREKFVIRMKTPLQGSVEVRDLIRGKVSFSADVLDDQILIKSDGFPTYHLANVVDDHFMKISHVIRGEEWLPSTPKHVLLYEYFNWKSPEFAHLPLLLNPDRSKLSKRHGDVAVESYRQKGYLAEALINFLALLGWNPGTDREIFTLGELIELFSVEKVSKAGAVFNLGKLNWMNSVYIRSMDINRLVELAKPFVPQHFYADENKFKEVLSIIRDGLTTLSEIKEKAALFYAKQIDYSTREAINILRKESARKVLSTLLENLSGLKKLDGRVFIEVMRKTGMETSCKGTELWMPVRVALTGQIHGPEIVKIVEVLGREEVLLRLEEAIKYADE